MLILTRRVGESIRIGEDVSVTVLGVKGNQVRLGIAAPRTVAVNRQEVHERIVAERDAVQPGPAEEKAHPAVPTTGVERRRTGRRGRDHLFEGVAIPSRKPSRVE